MHDQQRLLHSESVFFPPNPVLIPPLETKISCLSFNYALIIVYLPIKDEMIFDNSIFPILYAPFIKCIHLIELPIIHWVLICDWYYHITTFNLVLYIKKMNT